MGEAVLQVPPNLFVFPSLHFQCLTHTEKALKDFLPVTQARHGAGRVIHTKQWLLPNMYVSYHFRRFDYC